MELCKYTLLLFLFRVYIIPILTCTQGSLSACPCLFTQLLYKHMRRGEITQE